MCVCLSLCSPKNPNLWMDCNEIWHRGGPQGWEGSCVWGAGGSIRSPNPWVLHASKLYYMSLIANWLGSTPSTLTPGV